MPSLAQRLDAIEDLPTIPHTMQAVLSSLDSVSTSASRLEDIIKEDPSLTAKVLKIANSSYYGASQGISSLSRAIVTVGFEEVRSIVVGLSLSGIFCDDLGFEEFDAVDIWLHSIGVATCAKMIAKEVPDLDPDEMFTVGMLHDLGRILFCLYFAEELREVLNCMNSEGVSLAEAEEKCGLGHSDIGAHLAQRWQLSPMIVKVIRYHHNYNRAGEFTKAAAAINLADSLSILIKVGWAGLGPPQKTLIPKILGLDNTKVKKIAQKLQDQREELVSGWSNLIKT
ncbi:MAG: HDOD domain-containing protein [Proteobacteria bacterium]|nr:HDOD domain-containing protein [Pseudomonadota bacterium]MBU1688815.1 HDOD domain-containing protein [Pseudomonadota bacterium]